MNDDEILHEGFDKFIAFLEEETKTSAIPMMRAILRYHRWVEERSRTFSDDDIEKTTKMLYNLQAYYDENEQWDYSEAKLDVDGSGAEHVKRIREDQAIPFLSSLSLKSDDDSLRLTDDEIAAFCHTQGYAGKGICDSPQELDTDIGGESCKSFTRKMFEEHDRRLATKLQENKR
jgi:hypothetical protein